MCRECFFNAFESEIHQVIIQNSLFTAGDRVAIGASGGKDSTVLAYVLSKLNRLHNYGLHLFLLSVDEGITGYRDDSLQTYQLPLQVVSYKDLYGWTMDQIVDVIGFKNNCTFCGVFRRQALDRGAALLKVDKLVTGHNADDIAETVLLNLLRGDKWCKACVLLDGLNRGLPKLGIGRSRGGVGSENGNESKVEKSIQGKQCGTLDF
ncbi:hypothetical protein V8G54_006344 [Vigna mungo]|uniref:tRNA(Ile)-lysidine/2-thiocytidine synthase N-terminal domain-containing protein n=1 Tax=Vigna mungo TaxID=3915 RepID=A0AAQ3S6B7_VIGMU